jgi:hypothetical protein
VTTTLIKARQHESRFLAFDIVHAVEFSRIGRSQFSASRLALWGNFSTLPLVFAVSNRRFAFLADRNRTRPIHTKRASLNCSVSGFLIISSEQNSYKRSLLFA